MSHAPTAKPFGPLLDLEPRGRFEGDMVDAHPVAVEGRAGRRLRLPEAERAAGARDVPDRLAALALDLADPVPAERLEQLTVERQAAQDRADDEIYVVEAGGTHPRRIIYLGPDSSPPRP
jgi:hypothetical protein